MFFNTFVTALFIFRSLALLEEAMKERTWQILTHALDIVSTIIPYKNAARLAKVLLTEGWREGYMKRFQTKEKNSITIYGTDNPMSCSFWSVKTWIL
jgi:hypothetical protein